MSLFDPEDRSFVEKAAELVTTNPFHPDWMHRQRDLLGSDAVDPAEGYSWQPGWGLWGPRTIYPDLVRLGDRIEALAERACTRLRQGMAADGQELRLYHTLALYCLYRDHGEELDRYIDAQVHAAAGPPPDGEQEPGSDLKALWERFVADHARLLGHPGRAWPLRLSAEHLLACFFVLRRAFYHIFFNIIGTSPAVARLRGDVWQSIVTADLRGWSQGLCCRMHDFATLITGASGTGKELVAQAVGRSLYIPFDPRRKTFASDFQQVFHPVNLSALSPLLIESELFGHAKGAFTFAVSDRVGRLEECPTGGAVFLDEIGELNGELQVKLLRVLQTRTFQRVGENRNRPFHGKIIAATNRDLGAEMDAGRFREDFYYRLCADRIQTPSLRDQLADRPEDLALMVEFISRRVVGEADARRLTAEVVEWIDRHLGRDYGWPGNFRELEQCVRSYTIRKEYRPIRRAAQQPADGVAAACEVLAEAMLGRDRTYAQIERDLFARVYERTGNNLQEAARLLGVDWRTLKARVQGSGKGKRGS